MLSTTPKLRLHLKLLVINNCYFQRIWIQPPLWHIQDQIQKKQLNHCVGFWGCCLFSHWWKYRNFWIWGLFRIRPLRRALKNTAWPTLESLSAPWSTITFWAPVTCCFGTPLCLKGKQVPHTFPVFLSGTMVTVTHKSFLQICQAAATTVWVVSRNKPIKHHLQK